MIFLLSVHTSFHAYKLYDSQESFEPRPRSMTLGNQIYIGSGGHLGLKPNHLKMSPLRMIKVCLNEFSGPAVARMICPVLNQFLHVGNQALSCYYLPVTAYRS